MRYAMLILAAACGGSAVPLETPAEPTEEPTESAVEAEPELAAEAEDEDASEPADPFEAWVATMRMEEDVPLATVEVPEGYRERAGDALTTWTSPDNLHVITRHDHGVWMTARLSFDEPPEEMQPRLAPALHGGSWPHHVVLFEGRNIAIPMLESGALEFRVPLKAVGSGSLADTARVVHMTRCDLDEEVGCMAFGAPGDLRRAPNADVPSGFRLIPVDVGTSRRRLEWEEAEVYGAPELLLQEAEVGEEGPIVSRFSLRNGSRAHASFEIEQGSGASEYELSGKVTPVGDRQLVHVSLGWRHYFRVHRRNGRPMGAPIAYGIEIAIDEEAHGPAPSLEALVRGNRLVGLVLFGQLVFELDETVGRYHPTCVRPNPEAEYESPTYAVTGTLHELREVDGVICLAKREDPESSERERSE